MRNKFKIGDKVIASGMSESGKARVIETLQDTTCVEFESPVPGGHSDGDRGKDGHCLWFENDMLVLEREHPEHRMSMIKSICEDLIYASGDLEISDVFEKVRFLMSMYDKIISEGTE